MESRWREKDAGSALGRMELDWGRDLALRVYTSRLIGGDRDLVLHGGGNTSVKTLLPDVFGGEREVLYVKGSGADLAMIEPSEFPALELEGLRKLRGLETLSDEEMVNQLRLHLCDSRAPDPSVEALFHAFLPDKFVDHTHADAALVFGNRPEGAEELRELLWEEVGILPWIMSGLPLAKAVAGFRETNPEATGLILHKHGVFSWGPDAKTSYERMISIVDRLEREIERRLLGKKVFMDVPNYSGKSIESIAVLAAPALRRLTAVHTQDELKPFKPMVMEWRPAPEALAAAEDPEAFELFWTTGPLTPDHVIRTKAAYIVTKAEEEKMSRLVADYQLGYLEYFQNWSLAKESAAIMDDPYPRIVMVKGGGLFAFGETKRDAIIAADIAEHTIRGKLRAQALSRYEGLTQEELFDVEYWSLERAKLVNVEPMPLDGRIALVTGGAGAIGRSVCRLLSERGAHVLLTDLPGKSLEEAREELGKDSPSWRVHAVPMDVTDEESVKTAFDTCLLHFGGVDIVVMNAGIAHVDAVAALDLKDWKRVHEVNETGTFLCIREAARRMKHQRLGGQIILNASKNVPAPGADFAAYSASKAGAVQVAKVAALELARDGIQVNMVHADGVFEDEGSGKSSGLWDVVGPERMKSRGMNAEELRSFYKDRNLMGISVKARHVAEAIAFFAERRTPTTGAALTVDGGNAQTFYR